MSDHGHEFPAAPERGLTAEEVMRRIAQVANGLLRGESNNVRRVTLAPDATQTTMSEPRVKGGTVVVLSPETASAAASAASVYAVASTGSITIYHDSSPATDRTFGVAFHGAGAA